jgi:YD repeat-containing protein
MASHPFGSQTVAYGGAAVVRMGEMVRSCSDPVPLPTSTVITIPKGRPVMVGGPPAVNLAQAAGNFLAGRLLRTAWSAAGPLFKLVGRMTPTRLRNFLPKALCFFTGHPVDIMSGRVMTEAVDFELPGPLPLTFERSYSSGWSRRQGPLGWGWSHSLDRAIWVERAGVVAKLGDGREIVFDTSEFPHGEVPLRAEIHDPITGYALTRIGPLKWQLVDADGLVDEFERVPGERDKRLIRRGVARVVRSRRRNGKVMIRYVYDERARLTEVVDSAGRVVKLEYGERDRLARVLLPDPEIFDRWVVHCEYSYSGAGDLVAVKDAVGGVTRYAYAGRTHLMVQETDRNGLSFYWIYDGRSSSARCIRTWGDGGIFNQKLYHS